MADQDHVQAERVAAAADAWLRDPQDAQVYGRLVAATMAWRRAEPVQPPEPGEAVAPGAPGPPVARIELPPRLGDALGPVLTELHRRAAAPDTGPTQGETVAIAPTAVVGDGAGVGS